MLVISLALLMVTEPISVPRRAVGLAALEAGSSLERAERLTRYSRRWLGVPYSFGGNGAAGIDCSAFVRRVYRGVFDLELPRTTRGQIVSGVEVPLDAARLGANLRPADLIFFVDRRGTPNHVVLYLGNGRFAHSASGRGVVIEGFSALRGRRVTVRRVIRPAARGD